MTYEMLGRTFTEEEWESICNQCGLCCYEKYERGDGSIEFTNTPCRYLSRENTCKVYPYRFHVCDDCNVVNPEVVLRGDLLPPECTYVQLAARLKAEQGEVGALAAQLAAEGEEGRGKGRRGRWFRRWFDQLGNGEERHGRRERDDERDDGHDARRGRGRRR